MQNLFSSTYDNHNTTTTLSYSSANKVANLAHAMQSMLLIHTDTASSSLHIMVIMIVTICLYVFAAIGHCRFVIYIILPKLQDLECYNHPGCSSCCCCCCGGGGGGDTMSAALFLSLNHNFNWNPWDTLRIVLVDPFL